MACKANHMYNMSPLIQEVYNFLWLFPIGCATPSKWDVGFDTAAPAPTEPNVSVFSSAFTSVNVAFCESLLVSVSSRTQTGFLDVTIRIRKPQDMTGLYPLHTNQTS